MTDANGARVRGLGRNDFLVLEDGVPQEIDSVRELREPAPPAPVTSGFAAPVGEPEARPEVSSLAAPVRHLVAFARERSVSSATAAISSILFTDDPLVRWEKE